MSDLAGDQSKLVVLDGTAPDRGAVIFLSREVLDQDTIDQVARIIKHPAVSHARVMPDCHPGAGCCVGFTCRVTDLCVSPSIVGGDIGCGITSVPVKAKLAESDKAIAKVQRAFRECVPTGNGHMGVHAVPVADDAFLQIVLEHASAALPRLAARLQQSNSNDDAVTNAVPVTLDRSWLDARMAAWGVSVAMLKQHSGTLGGGNHFFEMDTLNTTQQPRTSRASSSCPTAPPPPLAAALLVVHSGSRYVGRCVYRYWMRVALASAAKDATAVAPADDDNVDDDFEVDNAVAVSAEVALRGVDAVGYLVDMAFAQAFAAENRRLMLSLVVRQLGGRVVDAQEGEGDAAQPDEDEDPTDAILAARNRRSHDTEDDEDEEDEEEDVDPWAWLLPWSQLVNSTHNYIDVEAGVLRKGAVEAKDGQLCIIAQNMRDGVWLCRGRGNPEWNTSAPHGTGRVVTRSSASAAAHGSKKNAEAALAKFRKEMGGVTSDSVTLANVDERPSVYREAHIVEEHMTDAVDVLAHYRVVLSCK